MSESASSTLPVKTSQTHEQFEEERRQLTRRGLAHDYVRVLIGSSDDVVRDFALANAPDVVAGALALADELIKQTGGIP